MKKKKPPIQTNSRSMNAALGYLYKRIDQITPSIYASFAIALNELGWDDEQIAALFARTQEIWGDAVENRDDIITYCSEQIGIDVRAGKE